MYTHNMIPMQLGFIDLLADMVGFFYILLVIGLALYGINQFIITMLYLSTKRLSQRRRKVSAPKQWPSVTIQLPIYNEKYTVKRLLRAVANLEYPPDQLQIQVLDDSTDDTAELVRRMVERCKACGVNMEWIHRTDRKGYKAGALNDGFHKASGELIAIFDADFVPMPDWLKRTVPLFKNPEIGCLQTRWGHTNREYNSLTRAEAMAIDGHFVVEQAARSSNDLFLNFNGTAGIWRRTCIEEAGGWQWDTLTEDLDLSYRAQMLGWKIDFLPDVVVPAELPSQVEAFKKQQYRWAKGSFQVVRKMLPKVFGQTELPLRVRLMALLHLTGYGVNPLMILLLLLTLPVGLLIPDIFKYPISVFAAFGPPLLYMSASASQVPSLGERLRLLPLLMLMGFGISVSTSVAVFEGLFSKSGGAFIRTPKLNLTNARASNHRMIDNAYRPPISPYVWVEIALGMYALLTVFILTPQVGWTIVPWMLIYMFGYFYIAGLNFLQHGSSLRSAG